MAADTAAVEPRRMIRHRALANLVILLLEAGRRTAGRVSAQPAARDAVRLNFRNVRTLTRRSGVFHVTACDFDILLMCPDRWPFEREAALVPLILGPADFRHPNSDGRRFCLDLEGIMPDRLVAVLYDNIRLRAFRLDHCVDADAADFVRANPRLFPTDTAPLYVQDTGSDCSLPTGALRDAGGALHLAPADSSDELPIVDVVIGVLGLPLPPITTRTFLRLAPPHNDTVDRARSAYLRRANAALRACEARWIEGAGILVDPAFAEPARLRTELRTITQAIRVLGNDRIAQSYLALFEANTRNTAAATP